MVMTFILDKFIVNIFIVIILETEKTVNRGTMIFMSFIRLFITLDILIEKAAKISSSQMTAKTL